MLKAIASVTFTAFATFSAIAALAKTTPPQPAPLQVTMRIDRDNAFVNEQVLITREVRANAEVFNVTGPELQIDGVDLVTVSATQKDEQTAHGNLRVRRTVYALFARTPGNIEVPVQEFLANLPANTAYRKNGEVRKNSKGNLQLKAQSDALRIAVQAAPPAEDDRIWFAASDVRLSSQWTDPSVALRVGEPKSRTVLITSLGQRAAAIVPLTHEQSPDFRSYPDPATLHDEISPTGLFGTRSEAMVIMPVKAGILTLPALKVNWFNTASRQWQHALLPAESVRVEKSRGYPAQFAPLWEHAQSRWLLAALIVLSAMLACACLVLLHNNRRLRRVAQTDAANEVAVATESAAWRAMRQMLRLNEPEPLRAALLQWAAVAWPEENILGLEQLAAKSADPRLRSELQKLDAALFSATPGRTKRSQTVLRDTLIALRTTVAGGKPTKTRVVSLMPLYPKQ